MNLISKQNRIRNNFYELNGKNVFHWNLRPLPLPRYNSSPIALIIFDWCFSARKFVIILILLIDWLCHCSCRSCSTCKAVQRVENCVFTQGQQWVVRFLGALFLEMFFFFFFAFWWVVFAASTVWTDLNCWPTNRFPSVFTVGACASTAVDSESQTSTNKLQKTQSTRRKQTV